MEDYDLSVILFCLLLWCMATAGRAQGNDDGRSVHLPDSARRDFEEWLRNAPPHSVPFRSENEPPKTIVRDSSILQPLPPQLPVVEPEKLKPQHAPVSVVIMTPALRQDMRLVYQSHWLEEQRKAQKGGAMTIGINPLCFIAWAVKKIFPKRKSKEQRYREQLQQILDNY